MAIEAFKQRKEEKIAEEITKVKSEIILSTPKPQFGYKLTIEGIGTTAKSYNAAVIGEPIPGTTTRPKALPKYGGPQYDYPKLHENALYALGGIAQEKKKQEMV